ncbi:MAG: heavy metal translocating P-type ATPase [Clostridia bacterium]|nr:heavy metal translocating P-type ATPase [Clostridia bacterium]
MKHCYTVTGMSCAACSARVEKAVKALDGAKDVSVNLLTGSMTLESDTLTDDEVVKAVTDAGYGAFPKDEGESGQPAPKAQKDARAEEQKRKKHILIWSFVLLAPLMYVSMGHMLGLPIPDALSRHHDPANFALLQFILCLPVALVNFEYYTRGFKALFRLSPNMDSLIATGSTASLAYGVASLFMINARMAEGSFEAAHTLAGDLYFEAAVMILALVDLGKYMEAKSKNRTGDALKRLTELAPQTALRERDGAVEEIPVKQLRQGDILQVKPGARVPADGTVIEGGASMDESMLTGESIPVFRGVGDKVTTATVNTDSFFRMRVDAVGADTSFSRILRMVEEAGASKPPISRLADRIAGIFVPVVMGLALLTAAVWLILGREFSWALTRAVAVLVVSCPCALGLATPVAVMVGTGRGAEKGILIRDGEALENAGKTDTLVADKTGTLTQGMPVVTRILPAGMDRAELLAYAAAAERKSEHPLAKAVTRCAEASGAAVYASEDVEVLPGRGIRAKVNGRTVECGSFKWLSESGVSLPGAEETLSELADRGETPLLVAVDGAFAGFISCADAVKPTSAYAAKALKENSVETVMLTGDNDRTAKAIAGRIGVERVVSGVLPGGKADEIRRLQAEGRRVAMLGDGINDAPALKTADTGIAIGAGTDVAIESADIILLNSDPADAVNAIRLSRAVVKNIKQNLFWAFFYNVLMIPVAAGALSGLGISLSPMLGSAAMSVSSLFVVTNALRLRRFAFLTPPSQAEEAPQELILDIPKEEKNDMTLKIKGMMCMHCVAHVKQALESIPGVQAEVDLQSALAQVTCPAGVSAEQLKEAVAKAGYEVVD